MRPMAEAPVARPAGLAGRRAVALIDLGAVERNCATLRGLLGDTALCAVVKADGYGHGAVPCARAALAGGATWLAVVTADEAAALRSEGVDARLLVMGALTEGDLDTALASGADVVCWRPAFAQVIARRAEAAGVPARLHVKLDTGMSRLGTPDVNEALAVVEAAATTEALELAGFMTHFATADEEDDSFFREQLERFEPVAERVKQDHPEVVVHAANSAAAMRDPRSHFDMARCGIAVYGLDPFQGDPAEHGLEPALRLESYVADVKRLEPGDAAGYGRTWSAPRATWIAVLPIGYGDGYRRGLSNRAEVLIRGRRHPVVGTVSMDNVTIDLGPETDVKPGDAAVLIGSDGGERILAEDLAHRLGTINYEITCGLSQRVRRTYLGSGP
jgi:alanine racemase